MDKAYCAKCGKERIWGSYFLDPEAWKKYSDVRDIDSPKHRWCRNCLNNYYLEDDRWKGKECPTCGQETEELDICGYYQSDGKTCGDPNCKRCLGSRALAFDVT